MAQLTPEMLQWLSDNREDYEFYLLHAMMHDYVWRCTMITTPLLPEDFRREEYALVLGAIINATKVVERLGGKVATPPAPEFLRTYLNSAAMEEGSDEEMINTAMQLLKELQNPDYKTQHYCVRPYFEAWYGSERAKKAARRIQMENVPDVHAAMGQVQSALSAAAQATVSEEDDMMNQFATGKQLERIPRRSTGISGLDECLNGGWGQHETYLLFGGTGGGKSIATGQCAWHEASANDGYPLIVSTELWPREYICRTVSNAVGIPVNIVQDCENIEQVKQAVAMAPGMNYKLNKVDEVLEKIMERMHIAKVSTEEGSHARGILEREALRYEKKFGRLPTWMALDWLGSMADVNGGNSSSDRAFMWEMSANSCVKFSEDTGIPLLVLAQAVNDAQLRRVLTLQDIGISKGIAKNMIAAIGITNSMDKAGVAAAVQGKGDMPRSMILPDQFFCLAKARKGEGNNIPVTRDFRFQRFKATPRD